MCVLYVCAVLGDWKVQVGVRERFASAVRACSVGIARNPEAPPSAQASLPPLSEHIYFTWSSRFYWSPHSSCLKS